MSKLKIMLNDLKTVELSEEIFEIEQKTKLYPQEHEGYIAYMEKIIYQLDWKTVCKHLPKRGCKGCIHLAEHYKRRTFPKYPIIYLDWCILKEYAPHGFYYPVPCEKYHCVHCEDKRRTYTPWLGDGYSYPI